MKATASEIGTFQLLEPELVPRGQAAFPLSENRVRHAVLAVCDSQPARRPDVETLQTVGVALQAATVTGLDVVIASRRRRGGLADESDHDRFFSMQRVRGDEPRIFLWSTLHAYRELLQERVDHGTSLEAAEWLELRYAFESIVRYALRESPGPVPDARGWPPADGPHGDPLRRWILGQRVFMALLQGLILSAHELGRGLADGGEAVAAAAFDLGAVVLWGSARAFRFATDFSRADYEERVRPVMMPPRAIPGLSGGLSHDHRYLMQTLAPLRPALEKLPPGLGPSYARFRRAFQATCDDHKLVCERCVGDKEPSLLKAMAHSEVSAVDDLDGLNHQRLQMLPVWEPR